MLKEYLHFQNMRGLLSKKATNGLLSVSQTIGAKKIIHDLNGNVVSKMSSLLNINQETMKPDELIKLITLKRNNGSLDKEIERQIKHVVYINKLKALKQLVGLLGISKAGGELSMPINTPKDLVDSLYFTTFTVNDVKG